MVAEEAFKQLQEIHGRHILSQSQSGRLHEWFELMEEVGFCVVNSVQLNCFWGSGHGLVVRVFDSGL